ncbi:hypothetical protein [Haliangium sp.]|uniref:hypothetical protein n=1 Tax=Haliangium sp. TaxID=2663208 RepID=UPI003D10C48D
MADPHQRSLDAGDELLAAGEAAMARGDIEQGFQLLHRAADVGVPGELLPRLVISFASAGIYRSRQREVLDWVEQVATECVDSRLRAALLRAQVSLWRGFDLRRAEDMVEEALAAAEDAEDEESFAYVLSYAAGAAYQRGRTQAATDYAERASGRRFQSKIARVAALRANMFAAVAMGELEQALQYSSKARAVARELGRMPDIASESNNLARFYLDLGCPIEARACAEEGIRMAHACGFERAEIAGKTLAASAAAESGDLDLALEQLTALPYERAPRFHVEAAVEHAYWLIERGADGDVRRASEIAHEGIEQAHDQGMANRLTPLYACLARSLARLGRREEARDSLEQARLAADRTGPHARLLLALAVAEVLPASEPKRKIVLTHARARIMRAAERREDPYVYCTGVRLNRRLLELSGGVPPDLPRSE